jgi:hypothetical protein
MLDIFISLYNKTHIVSIDSTVGAAAAAAAINSTDVPRYVRLYHVLDFFADAYFQLGVFH